MSKKRAEDIATRGRGIIHSRLVRWLVRIAALLVTLCAARALADVPVAAPTWTDGCEERLRAAALDLIADGLPGPIFAWRERPTEWGASEYDAFIDAAARDPKLRRRLLAPDPSSEPGLILAVGESLKFRVVLVPIDCRPRASEAIAWFDKKKYWDPDELDAWINGVSVALHVDPSPSLRKKARRFIEVMRPIVDQCVARRPPLPVARACSPHPG
jgi:hypothetical protein